MRALIWLGGFLCGAALMLAAVLWMIEGTDEVRFPWPTS